MSSYYWTVLSQICTRSETEWPSAGGQAPEYPSRCVRFDQSPNERMSSQIRYVEDNGSCFTDCWHATWKLRVETVKIQWEPNIYQNMNINFYITHILPESMILIFLKHTDASFKYCTFWKTYYWKQVISKSTFWIEIIINIFRSKTWLYFVYHFHSVAS